MMPRFRVRTLMAAVCVLALLLWGAMLGTRSYDYYRRARVFGAHERGWRSIAARHRGRANVDLKMQEFESQCVEYYAQLTQKYRRAMWRPLTPVAPDPHAPGYDQWLEQERRANRIAPDPLAPEGSAAPE